MSDIGIRARKVLHAVVSEYLATGEAVGSHTVARRYALEVSPATVRATMGDLEEAGLLRHPHTSSGRIPTDRGLRLYVDTLLRVRSLTASEKETIRGRLGFATELQEIMQRVARLLRELSHLAVVVQAPRPKSDEVSHIEFVRLREDQLLAIIASTSGQIQNKVVHVDFSLSPGDLDRINNYLNGLFAGLTLDDMRRRVMGEIANEKARSARDPVLAKALGLAAAAMPAAERAGAILFDGQSNLLAETADLERARSVLRTLEEKDQIVKLLDRTLAAPGICVFIGTETRLADLDDMSVVAASYGSDDRPLGSIGVIGPSRMNYSRVIPLVDFTADAITEILPRI
ncbi:MAG: heat-inducible transcription repressor HrcA [Deltaproteobacteria bacterium]|nr:heat-inducible transcription repressor HrcA [Deltaproteobacteria bacterium]